MTKETERKREVANGTVSCTNVHVLITKNSNFGNSVMKCMYK